MDIFGKEGFEWKIFLLWKRLRNFKFILKGFLRRPFLYLGIILLFLGLTFFYSFNKNQRDITSPFSPEKEFSPHPFFLNPPSFVGESPPLSFIQKNSLAAISPVVQITPQVLGALVEGSEYIGVRREIIEHIVREGESLWLIANEYGISIDTIVWANNIDSALIRPGQKLLILPVSGVMHLVKAGDTIAELAEKYKTGAEKIIAFNDLSGEGDIFEGEVLIIPDGRMPRYSAIQPVDPGALARLSTNNFYGRSHAYPYGQCTWWVAQKRAIPSWGHAKDWLNNAAASGFLVCRGRYCLPRPGAVISLSGNRIYGHVGYVEQVKGNKVIFSEMNYIGWGRMNYRTLRIGDWSIRGYIY